MPDDTALCMPAVTGIVCTICTPAIRHHK